VGSEGAGLEVEKQNEGKRLLELKMVGLQRNASEPKTCSLGVVLAEGRRPTEIWECGF